MKKLRFNKIVVVLNAQRFNELSLINAACACKRLRSYPRFKRKPTG